MTELLFVLEARLFAVEIKSETGETRERIAMFRGRKLPESSKEALGLAMRQEHFASAFEIPGLESYEWFVTGRSALGDHGKLLGSSIQVSPAVHA